MFRPFSALRMSCCCRGLLVARKGGAEVEYETLMKHRKIIGESAEFSFVDIASSNGVSQSAIWPLLDSFSSVSGLACEVDSGKFATLSLMYSRYPDVGLHRGEPNPTNVCDMLRAHRVAKEFQVLNFDIDSYDLELLQAILRGGWKPHIISLEINEKIPPPIYFNVLYRPGTRWDGSHFYGCSISAALEGLRDYPYAAVELAGNNLILLESSLLDKQFQALTADDLFGSGYRDVAGRDVHFPWNRDVDDWLTMESEDAMRAIRLHFSEFPKDAFVLRRALSSDR